MWEEWKRRGRRIFLYNPKNRVSDEREGYDIDLKEMDKTTKSMVWKHYSYLPDPSNPRQFDDPAREELLDNGEVLMHSLIVALKGPALVPAMRDIKHRINAESTIVFLQNGMGQIEELNREVFTDPATRPTYILGIVTHGAYVHTPFVVNHAGFGTISLGVVRDLEKHPHPPKTGTPLDPATLPEPDRKKYYPTDTDLYANLSARYLLRTLTRSPVLACAVFPSLDLFQLQLEKLAMNAVLNPLTALLNVPNGSMLHNDFITRAQRLLFAEISLVIRSLPELQNVPNVRLRFSPERLETLFFSISTRTAQNSSSMREDVRHGKETEIAYINGYIVKRGEELGIKCVMNYLLMQLIQAKSYDVMVGQGEVLPFGVSRQVGKMAGGYTGKDKGVIIRDVGLPGRTDRV